MTFLSLNWEVHNRKKHLWGLTYPSVFNILSVMCNDVISNGGRQILNIITELMWEPHLAVGVQASRPGQVFYHGLYHQLKEKPAKEGKNTSCYISKAHEERHTLGTYTQEFKTLPIHSLNHYCIKTKAGWPNLFSIHFCPVTIKSLSLVIKLRNFFGPNQKFKTFYIIIHSDWLFNIYININSLTVKAISQQWEWIIICCGKWLNNKYKIC